MADEFGILVGWTHQRVRGHLILSLESIHTLEQNKLTNIDKLHLHLTLNQATVLGNFLLATSGRIPTMRPRASLWARWFGV